jgi:hypothetical protein
VSRSGAGSGSGSVWQPAAQLTCSNSRRQAVARRARPATGRVAEPRAACIVHVPIGPAGWKRQPRRECLPPLSNRPSMRSKSDKYCYCESSNIYCCFNLTGETGARDAPATPRGKPPPCSAAGRALTPQQSNGVRLPRAVHSNVAGQRLRRSASAPMRSAARDAEPGRYLTNGFPASVRNARSPTSLSCRVACASAAAGQLLHAGRHSNGRREANDIVSSIGSTPFKLQLFRSSLAVCACPITRRVTPGCPRREARHRRGMRLPHAGLVVLGPQRSAWAVCQALAALAYFAAWVAVPALRDEVCQALPGGCTGAPRLLGLAS